MTTMMTSANTRIRWLLLGGAVGPLCFATAVLIGASLRPEYDHSMQVMSALGGTGSPNAILMNGLGFLPMGLLTMAFGFALYRLAPRSIWSGIGGLLVGLFGSGIVAAGMYSCDPGCVGVGSTREAYLHIVASVIAFLSGIAACFAWGGAFRSDPAWRPLSNLSLLAGIVSGGLLFAFNTTSGTDAYPGIWQRLFIGALFGWCAVVALRAFRLTGEQT
jgi:hypothetical membrane protein